MKNWASYKRVKPKKNYDVIIIGSGIGGLAAAAILGKEGYSVLVLERHYTIGGFTHVFKRKDFEWDVGLHYIGEAHREGSFINVLFNYISDGELKWEPMENVFDRIYFGDKSYDYVTGREELIAKFKEYFPAEEAAIDQYFSLVKEVQRASRNFFMEKALPPLAAKITGGKLRKKMLEYSRKTTYEVLRELTDNEELIAVLTGQYGDYGLPPKQSSFVIHCQVTGHYFNGGCYPVGGSGRIAETVAAVIEKNGGLVLSNADVAEVLTEGKKAVGVRMEDGNEYRSKLVISNAGVWNTFSKLVPENLREKLGFTDKLKKVEPSVAHVCLYVGLEGTTEELDLKTTNYWIYPDNYDHDQNVENYLKDPENSPLPVCYVSFPSAKDPDWERRFPGRSTIEIITLAPYEWFQKWEDSRWKKRGEEYDAYKERISEQLLNELYKKNPNLKGKVIHAELSTPLSTKHFANYQMGEIYGLQHTPDRFEHKFLRADTPIKNFYLTGQDIVTVGIGGGLAGGLLTASAIRKKNLVAKIFDAVKFEKQPPASANGNSSNASKETDSVASKM